MAARALPHHSLDPSRFPETTAYLAALPRGIDSFPDCYAATDGYRDTALALGRRLGVHAFPDAFAQFLLGHGPQGQWMPEVFSQLVHTLVADLDGEEAMLQWKYEQAAKLFDRPLLRPLMRVLSPTLIVMGAARRWGAVHRGSTLDSAPLRKEGDIAIAGGIVKFPAGLFSRAFCRGQTQAFRAALDGARAKDVEVKLARLEAETALYEVRWR